MIQHYMPNSPFDDQNCVSSRRRALADHVQTRVCFRRDFEHAEHVSFRQRQMILSLNDRSSLAQPRLC